MILILKFFLKMSTVLIGLKIAKLDVSSIYPIKCTTCDEVLLSKYNSNYHYKKNNECIKTKIIMENKYDVKLSLYIRKQKETVDEITDLINDMKFTQHRKKTLGKELTDFIGEGGRLIDK